MSYGPDIPGQYRRAAIYVDKILRVRNRRPTRRTTDEGRIRDNLKTATALSLTVPPTLLARADSSSRSRVRPSRKINSLFSALRERLALLPGLPSARPHPACKERRHVVGKRLHPAAEAPAADTCEGLS
jgi:hypothetical protein